MDIAIAPVDSVPARFVARTLFEEDFVVVARARHPFAAKPTLEQFCRMRHLVVSLTGDAHGFIDTALEKQGLARRVALTVPDFAMGLATVADTDLIAAMPRRFVTMHAPRFGLVSREVPLRMRKYSIRAIATRAAMMDAGLGWLFGVLQDAFRAVATCPERARQPVAGPDQLVLDLPGLEELEPPLCLARRWPTADPGRSSTAGFVVGAIERRQSWRVRS